jgi:DNA replication protein DnaC
MECPFGICDGSGFVFDEQTRTTAACRCRPQRIAERRARRLSSKIPERFIGVSFDREPIAGMDPHIVAEVRRYITDLDANLDAGRGLWFMGDVGTGKTSLAMLVAKSALERRRTVAIYSVPRLLSELRRSMNEDSETSFLDLVDALASVDLLQLDDLGAEKSSEWVLEQLYAIINARYEERKAIVLTTNLDPAQLEEQITERTVSRLVEMCGDPVALFGEDRRKAIDAPILASGPLRYGELPT